jgi:SPASM domain peptide maturase of grasp-with-spasm system
MKPSSHQYFTLFACCIPVRGATRSVICDVQRQHFDFIPNILFEILTGERGLSYGQLIHKYGAENEAALEEYFSFLTEYEYGFWCDDAAELERFPPIQLHWEIPYAIHNCIIDMDESSNHDFAAIIRQLESLACPALQLRSYSPRPPAFYENILQQLHRSVIRSVEIVTPFTTDFLQEAVLDFVHRYGRIAQITLHSAPYNKIDTEAEDGLTKIIYTTEAVNNATHCGIVDPAYFLVNLALFSEAQQHNTCLNKKIAIDAKGEIKNCPSMKKSYGNIASVALAEALAAPGFTAQWKIAKDQVSVCRDCEFRYICTDCRAYLSDESDPLSKPAKCNYDPYSASWSATHQPAHHAAY